VTSSGTGPLAASAGVGLLGGAVAGALIGKFTHLNIKATMLAGTVIGGALGVSRGFATR